MEIAINYLAVIVAALVAYAVGAVWHSPIGFSAYWMKLMGFNEHSMKSMPLTPAQAMSLGALVQLLQAYVLAHFVVLLNVTTLETGLQLGFWVWLGFLAPTLANGWLWEGKSLKLFAFNAAYSIVSIEVMALILSVWR